MNSENDQPTFTQTNDQIIAVIEGLLLDIDGLFQEGFDTNIRAKHLPHEIHKGYVSVAIAYLAKLKGVTEQEILNGIHPS